MKRFDPALRRKILDGDSGYRFYLGRDFERSRSRGGLASSAHGYLSMAIECLLVGYDGPATELLKRASNWLIVAIQQQEKPRAYGVDGTEAERYLNLAMCNWLLHSIHDVESLRHFVEHEDRFLSGSEIGRDKANVSLTLIGYVDAGAYQQALERFAAAGFSDPEPPSLIRNEAQMCYALCVNRLGQEHSEAAVVSATEKFLQRSVNAWLTDGDFVRAAQWMKVVHWQEGRSGLSAKQVVLKCYEYLTDVAPLTSSEEGL